ncbi:MAG: hypothetical protein C5B54_10700 [Acidobacteria bacterium]|nr:MAG: hypothetical protein C5B54_10700 [Acidobacteriota bacterium]
MLVSATPQLESASLEAKRRLVTELLQAKLAESRYFPLSHAQQRLWFLDQLSSDNQVFNFPLVVRLSGNLCVEAVGKSIREIVRRHDVLRTRFVMRDGETVQEVLPSTEIELPVIEVHGAREDQKEKEEDIVVRMIGAELGRGFNLAEKPPLHALLLRVNEREHVIAVIMHHIICDGWYTGLLVREFAQLYPAFCAGQESPLKPLEVQYSDYAVWQRRWLQGEVLERQMGYWRKQLEDLQTLELPTDFPRTIVVDHPSKAVPIALSESLTRKLQELSRHENATLFMTLLAALEILLARYTRQEDIAVGSVIANRNRAEAEELIGYFVNALVLRVRLGGNPSFRELLARVRQTMLDAYAHQDMPFEKLVEDLAPERELGRHPLFQVRMALQNVPTDELKLAGLELKTVDLEAQTTPYDLSFILWETKVGLSGVVQYAEDLFEEATIKQILLHYEAVLEQVSKNPDVQISALNLLSAEQRVQLLEEWNRTASDSPWKSVQQLFEDQVEKSPDALAVLHEGQQLTYTQLNAKANQLAHALRERGVGPEVCVGIFMKRSLSMIIAVLGVLKSGGAYLPLDAKFPQERLKFMLEDGRVPVLLTESHLRDQVPSCWTQMICLDDEAEAIGLQSESNLPVTVSAENLVYIIYTSGSTGRPKGVAIQHNQLFNYVTAISRRMPSLSGSRLCMLSTLAADLGNTMLFPALCGGGILVIPSEEAALDSHVLQETFQHKTVDCFKITPSHLAFLLTADNPAALLPQKLLILGGEASPWDWVHGVRDLRPECAILNHYGPTECTVGATTYSLDGHRHKPSSSTLPLGRALDNVQTYVLDDAMEPLPIGVPGELYIGGNGVGRGYLNCTELTAAKFMPDPFSRQQGARMYATGDLVRWSRDGYLEFLGRIDQQVKIRGYRVELGEVETVLRGHKGVKQCAVILQEVERNEKRLVAYVVSHAPQSVQLEGSSVHVLPNGLTVAHLNRNETEYLYHEIFESEVYLRFGIELPEDACVFDVGANIGMFTLFVSGKCPHGQIYSFEPIPSIYDKLQRNASLCNAKVTVFQTGVAGEESSADFTFYPNYTMMSGMETYANPDHEMEVLKCILKNQRDRGDAGAEQLLQYADELLPHKFEREVHRCRLRPLSDVIREEEVQYIHLLKIDVQRAEMDALAGIEEQDWKKVGQIVMEVHDAPGYETEGRVEEIVQLLEKRDFEVVAQQYEELKGTDRWNIYAKSKSFHVAVVNSSRKQIARMKEPKQCVVSGTELREYLQAKLPDYMVPGTYVFLELLPLTANGKLDRRALPDPARSQQKREYAGPRSPIEQSLCQIWQEVLQAGRIGIHDNFFELGGHSLLATQVISRVRKAFDVEVPLRALFESPTIAGLALVLGQLQSQKSEAHTIEIKRLPRQAYRPSNG